MFLQGMAVRIKPYCILISAALLVLIQAGAKAQEFYLARKVSLTLHSVTVETALMEISRRGDFSFSYNTGLFRKSGRVDVQARNTRVKTVLEGLFGNRIINKEVGSHVILLEAPVKKKKKPKEKSAYVVTGTVSDAETRLPVANATVYELEKRRSALTDSLGHYSLVLPPEELQYSLCFCKQAFDDTVLFVHPGKENKRDVRLRMQPPMERIAGRKAELRVITVDSIGLVTWMVPEKALLTSANLRVYGTRPFQISLIPYLSTNWMNKGSYSNAVSFNVLAGYNGGVNGFELGGLVNINRNTVRGFQLAGLGNITGGKTRGTVFSGLFNINLAPLNGLQASGFVNVLTDTLKGVQVGGLCNWMSGKMKGLQIAGFLNVATKNVDGFQISGIMNFSPKDISKSQITGILNIGRDVGGLQFSALANVSSGEVHGAQISGLFNWAATVRGLQFALLNLSDSVETGVPIGLFSYTNHGGYHRFEVWADEVFYANLAFKSGTRHFYNIFSAGIGQEYFLDFGYGIGTLFRFGRVVSMSLDLTTAPVFSTKGGMKYHGLLSRLVPAVEFRLARHLAVFAGPAADLYWFNTGLTERPNGIAPYIILERTAQPPVPHQLQFWVGGYAGIRI